MAGASKWDESGDGKADLLLRSNALTVDVSVLLFKSWLVNIV